MKNFVYNVDFICRRPHFKSNTDAAISIFNIFYILCNIVLDIFDTFCILSALYIFDTVRKISMLWTIYRFHCEV